MSDLFPYNHHHGKPTDCEPYNDYQGSPIDYPKARAIIDEWYWWHHEIAQTDTWTQSNDGADDDMHKMALGLIAFSADPTFLHMLEALGAEVHRVVSTLWNAVSRDETRRSEPAIAACIAAKIGRFATLSDAPAEEEASKWLEEEHT